MTREEIERLAREAKGHPYTNRYTPGETAFAFSIDRLEHFVSLVAAAEREACAKVCDEIEPSAWHDGTWTAGWSDGTEDCAAAIRARGAA